MSSDEQSVAQERWKTAFRNWWKSVELWDLAPLVIPVAVLLGAVFVFWSNWAVSSRQSQADAIRAVISQDKAAGDDIVKSRTLWELVVGVDASKVDTAVWRMKSIDTSRCPKEFRSAYAKHVDAWQSMAVAYRANGHTNLAYEDIKSTWQDVHRVAQEYGVHDALR